MTVEAPRVVIAGGSGLIGRALTEELVQGRYAVVVLTRGRGASVARGARAAYWDARGPGQWTRELEGAAAVINLAGESLIDGRWSVRKRHRIRQSRMRATMALVDALEHAERRPGVLLQGSAVGCYGDRGEERLTERAPPGDGFLAEVCQAWEGASEPVERLGMRRACLRTGVVLSNEGGALPRMELPFRLFVGGPLGRGEQWVPWIHIRDAVRAVRFLLEHDQASGPFNLTAPNPVRAHAVALALSEALHRPAALRAPRRLLRLALGHKAEVLLASQRAVPARLEQLGFTYLFDDVRGAVAALLPVAGWTARLRRARDST